MAERVDGAELLRAAQETLDAVLAPLVPAEQRYELLMVANAIGIAARELQAGDGPAQRALARLEALYGAGAGEGFDDPRAALERVSARFATDIRAGRFDAGDERARAASHLRATALDAVRVSNPRFLQRRGFEGHPPPPPSPTTGEEAGP